MLKYIVMTCLGLSLAGTSFSQVTGNWYGAFRTPQGNKQRLQLTINGNKGQMKSPDITQDLIDIDSVYATADSLKFFIKKIDLVYTGAWRQSTSRYEGYFEQLGNRAALYFSKRDIKEEEHTPAIAYDVEEVKFVNTKEKVLLTGTFTKPGIKGTFPAVIMISGEGPQDRDGENFGHKPFAVIADYFAKHGMAVLRFDDRGTGSSTGSYDSSNLYNFAEDVRAAVNFLRQRKDVDSNAIGMLGTGLGGAVAEIVASKDDKIAFIMMMAGPGVSGIDNYKDPNFKTYLNILINEKDTTVRRQKAYASLKKEIPEEMVATNYQADTRPEMLSALKYDPAPYLATIKCPVLAMNGDKDLEVDAALNLKGIEKGLLAGGNQTITLRTFPGLNHLFQRCNSCTIEEYGTLDETINPAVLEFMVRWVQLLY
jgi:uncharacterized protein